MDSNRQTLQTTIGEVTRGGGDGDAVDEVVER